MKESLIARSLSRMELFFTDADAEMMPVLFKNILDGLAQFWNLLSKDMSVIYI
jgi:lipopolysaccharide/colanic/teichoic acid biosynthesis glycosyltransferase